MNQSNDNPQQHLLVFFPKIYMANFCDRFLIIGVHFVHHCCQFYMHTHLLLSVKYFCSVGNQNQSSNASWLYNKYWIHCRIPFSSCIANIFTKKRSTNFVKAKVNWSCYLLVNIMSTRNKNAQGNDWNLRGVCIVIEWIILVLYLTSITLYYTIITLNFDLSRIFFIDQPLYIRAD